MLHAQYTLLVLGAQLCLTLCNPKDCGLPGSSVHGILQARILGVGSQSHLQGIFLTQELNLGLLPCRQILSLNLYLFAKASIRKYHRLGGLNNRNVFLHTAGS